ncbi:hypothetical protein BD769DRAFT_1676255 [Suillus cothurnatus]|nr:hypothetical protein BD769DRAFT_1676255 [Suillus cothurnatus]
MEIEQAGAIAKVVPVKPRPRLVKQKPCVAEDAPSKNCSMLGTQTSSQSKGDHTLKSVADNMGTDGDCELELESEAKPKRKKKVNLLLCKAVSATRLKKQNEDLDWPDDLMKVDQPGRSADGKAHGLDKKGKNIEVSTSIPSATTFSQAMEPPSMPPKTLKSVLKVTCSDDDDDANANANVDVDVDVDVNDESNSEERAAIIAEKGKGKAAMKTVIEIDSSTNTELHTAPIAGNGDNKTATNAKLTTPSLQESDADDDTVLSLPLTGTPFADLPYDRQLEIVSFALEQAPCTGKRKIEEITGELGLQVEDNSVNYEDGDDAMEFGDDTMELRYDAMELDSEIEDASPIAKKVLKGTNSVGHTTTATSVTAIEKPLVLQPAKKAKLEPATTQTLMTTTMTKVPCPAKKVKSEATSKTSITAAILTVPESMLADMAIKPAAGNGQWQNTDLPPILTENGLWHRQFIPTVLLWAGSQSSFWTIKAADLLCAVQAIFNMMYPKVKYNIQPRGPIMGMITQHLCTWHSNFGSTAIALIANFLASLRESKDEDEDKDEDENENTDSREKFMTQMAASLLKGYAFLFADPNTCKASEIYRSVFMLQMITMTHLNTVTGFVDVPELDTCALSLTRMECVIGAYTVALKHALKLVAEKEKKSTNLKTPLKINKSTSKESSTPLAFSELNWGQFTIDYHLSIGQVNDALVLGNTRDSVGPSLDDSINEVTKHNKIADKAIIGFARFDLIKYYNHLEFGKWNNQPLVDSQVQSLYQLFLANGADRFNPIHAIPLVVHKQWLVEGSYEKDLDKCISRNAPNEWKFKAAGGHHRTKAIEAWMNKMKTKYEMVLAEETRVDNLPVGEINYIDKVVKLRWQKLEGVLAYGGQWIVTIFDQVLDVISGPLWEALNDAYEKHLGGNTPTSYRFGNTDEDVWSKAYLLYKFDVISAMKDYVQDKQAMKDLPGDVQIALEGCAAKAALVLG